MSETSISRDLHNDMANAIRFLAIDAVQTANSGHPGMPMGMADVATVLFARHIKINPSDPAWPDRDRFVLSAGHGSMAIDLAGHLRLDRLTVLWDDNSISIDGGTELSTSTNQLSRFRAAGWHVQTVDGHDPEAIDKAISVAVKAPRPSLIACKTTIGYGSPNLAGTAKTHGAPLGADEVAATRAALGWTHDPFVIPEHIAKAWNTAGQRSLNAYADWQSRHGASRKMKQFDAALGGVHPQRLWRDLKTLRQQFKAEQPKLATRQSSQQTLEVINGATALTIGGSADLTGSNLTRTSQMESVSARKFKGRYIYFGVREHGMAAAMNGMALHGGMVPYGGTFLVFSDYARGAMRLSALMGQQVIYVMTHDSIGLGEDGPTHQPVEHLAMLRATPNLYVFRPGDAVEVAESWEAALTITNAPSVLSLSRQATPTLRRENSTLNQSLKGGYVLIEPGAKRDVTIIATGTELALAVEAAEKLKADHGIHAAVVSMPCQELFEQQDLTYQEIVLGFGPRIAVEAASGFGWERYTSGFGAFVGMNSFGESAPASDLYQHFGITVEAVVAKAIDVSN